MQPTPLTTALPRLAAQIDAERPLISAALLDILVTEIGDDVIIAEVTTQHSYDILTSPAQHEYLNRALSTHWDKPASVSLTLHIPSNPPPTTANHSQPPQTSLKRIANTLAFRERTALQQWMSQDENRAFVANESDADAARQATQDFALMVKAMAGAEHECEPAFPGLIITAGNIASMRKLLGIEKVKPVKPAPPSPPHDIDLVALHAKVEAHDLQLAPIAGVNIAEVLSNLRNSIHEHKERLDALESANN
jgi:hypothetical protein